MTNAVSFWTSWGRTFHPKWQKFSNKIGLQFFLLRAQVLCFQLDFQLKTTNAEGEGEGDLGSYVTNGEWDLLGNVTNDHRHGFSCAFLHSTHI